MDLSIEKLRSFPLLSVLSEQELGEIQKKLSSHTLSTDEVLLPAGEYSHVLYFVLSGWLKAEKVSQEGRPLTLRLIGPGETINELAVFSNDVNDVSVIAMEPCQIVSLSQAAVEALLSESASFSRAVIRNLALRIEYLLGQIENLSLFTVEERLARHLLENASEGVMLRQSWKTQSEIAAQLGTVPDVLNRHIQNFVKQGWIDVSRGHIRIIDKQALEELIR